MSLEGQQLGEFEILELLGKGGMGAVYKARQVSLGRFVALKTLQGSLADDPEYIARFRQEAKAAAMLNHPNLVQVYSAGETAGLHWFAMEFVEGETAKMRLRRKGRIDSLQALAITIHVSMALEHGWRKAGLIHRDIKPDNILLSADGEVKLGDLGLAKSIEQASELTTSGSAMGTPHYMSPEQIENSKDVDFRADIYSLGCTLYTLLAGQPPYAGNSSASVMVQHMNGLVPDLRSVWPECPAELNGTVRKMMQKHPAARQQNYEQLLTNLRCSYDVLGKKREAELAGPASTGVAVRKPERKPAARSTAFVAWVAGAAAVSSALIVLLILHFGRSARPREEQQAIRTSGPASTPEIERSPTPPLDQPPAPAPIAEAVTPAKPAVATPASSPPTVAASTPPPNSPAPTPKAEPAAVSSSSSPGKAPAAPLVAGDLDPTFGDGGKVITPFGTGDNWASGMAVQNDGKILVSGLAFDGTAWNVWLLRYDPDGTLEHGFDRGNKPIRFVAKGAGSARTSMAIQPDRKIVVTGAGGIARYNPDGTLDLSFNGTGIVSHVDNTTQAVRIQADGKIVVAGHWSTVGKNDFAVSRYNADGSRDKTFNGVGTVMTSIGSEADICHCVALQADGKIVAAGYTTLSTNPQTHRVDRAFALVRYNVNGSLDTSFNGTGKVTTEFTPGDDEAHAITIQEDGKILAVGFSTGPRRDLTLARYNRDGSLDTTFNDTGKVTTTIGFIAIGYGVIVQRDGRIVVGGTVNDHQPGIMFARYNANGTLDTTLQGTGTVTTSIGTKSDSGLCLALQKDGKVLVAGRTQNGKGSNTVLVRYLGSPAAAGQP